MLKLSDISFGEILTDLLAKQSLTDLMIWDKDVWVSDIYLGHYQIDLSKYEDEKIKQMLDCLSKLPYQIAVRMNCGYNESNPILDGEGIFDRLGQLRFNVIHENLTSTNFPAFAIRKSNHFLRLNDEMIINTGYASNKLMDLLKLLVKSGSNVMISGITGSGKTELLRYLAANINSQEAIITIEDTLEAYLKDLYPSKNILALKSSEHVSFQDLLRPCLRQNPDWICVSETRGKEVLYLLEAVSTGHHLLSTLHSDSAFNIPVRMLEMSGINETGSNLLYQKIYNHIDIGIHISYFNDESGAKRKIDEVCEYYLDKDNKSVINCLYRYDFKTGKEIFNNIESDKVNRKLAKNQLGGWLC